MTKSETIELLAAFTASFPYVKLQDNAVDVFARCLADVPAEIGRAAALKLVCDLQYFPTISQIREAALSLMPGGEVPSVGEAWSEVVEQMKDIGSYGEPRFSHRAISEAVRAMDWKLLCLSENPIAERAHFFQIYGCFREQAVEERRQLPEVIELKRQLIEKQEAKRILGEIATHAKET